MKGARGTRNDEKMTRYDWRQREREINDVSGSLTNSWARDEKLSDCDVASICCSCEALICLSGDRCNGFIVMSKHCTMMRQCVR